MDDARVTTPNPGSGRSARSGRWLRRFGDGAIWALGLSVLLVAGAALGLIAFSRRPESARIALRFVNRALTGSTDLRLTAERTLLSEHGARILRPVLSIVDSTGAARPLLTARELAIGTTWGGLLFGGADAFRLDLRDARVYLRRRPDGSWLLPAFRGTGRPPAAQARLDLDLHLANLAVIALDGLGADARAETLVAGATGEVKAQQRGSRWDVDVLDLRGRGPAAGLLGAKLAGRARYDGGALDLTRFRLESDAGWIAGAGRGRISPRLDLAGRLALGEVTWSRLARWTGQDALDLPGGVAGTSGWRAQGDSVALDGARFDVLWRDEPMTVGFDGRWAQGRLALDQGTVAWREATFHGGFELDTKQGGGWAIDGRLGSLDLAELPRLWPMPDLDASRLDGDVRLLHDRRGYTGTVRDADGTWRDLPVRDLRGTWAMAGRVQTIDARSRLGGGSVGTRGTIGPAGLDLAVSAAAVDAAAIPPATWAALGIATTPEGRVEALSARLTGPARAPRATGRARLADVGIEGATMGAADLDFDGVFGAAPEGGVTLAGRDATIGPARADTVTARVSFSDRTIVIEDLRASRGDSVLALGGRLVRDGDAWDVTFDRATWDVGEALALESEGLLRVRLESDGRIEVVRAHVLSNAGSVAAAGTWGGKSGQSDLVLELETLDLESMLAPFVPAADARGIVTGRAHIEGMGKNTVYTIDLEGRDLRWRRLNARHAIARGRLTQSTWKVEQLNLDTGRGRLKFTGDLAWAEPPALDADAAEWNRALTDAPRWHGELVADSLAVDQLADWFPQLGGWRGVLDLTCLLDGRPASPVVRVTGAIHRPGWGQATLDDFDVDLRYHDDLVTVHRLAMAGPDSLGPSVTGSMPLSLGWGVKNEERLPDRPMEIDAFAHGVDLSIVPLLLPQIAAAGGKFDFDARLTGTPRKPELAGSITIRDGIVRPASREEVLTDVDGRVVLEGDKLIIQSLTARQGKRGRLVVKPGGSGTIEDLRLVEYALDVQLEKITAFSSGEYVIVLDAALQVTDGIDAGGPLPLPHITGTAFVDEALFLYNFADPTRQQMTQGPLVLPPWTYAIDVDADKNVWYRPTDANIEGRLTGFRVMQDADRFRMLGEVEALRGRYYFLGNGFDLQTGNLFFDAAQEMDPTVDAVLTTEKVLDTSQSNSTRETITLTVTGRAQSPRVTLTSTPSALAQGEIVRLLTYGQIKNSGGTALVAAGSQMLARQLSQEVPEVEKYLGTIEVGQRYSEGKDDYASEAFTTVGLTRYFTNDLLVRYSQVVGDVSQTDAVDYQDLTAEYRLNRLLFLSGQVTRRRGVLITSQDQTIYNLDVRARHEY